MTFTLSDHELYNKAKRLVENEVRTSVPFSWIEILVNEGEVSEDLFYGIGEDEDGNYNEIYEVWIVSDWLADKLRAKGECVTSPDDWIQIWGRGTTGQAICLDYVIQSIVDDMYQVV